MKILLILFLLLNTLYAEDTVESQENNTTASSKDNEILDLIEPVLIKDESGLSDDELRNIAKEADAKKKEKKVSIEKVIDNIDSKGSIDISKVESKWEDLSPTPVKYDWIQTKSGEWFKGEIKAMYDDQLEFDSDEVGIHTFDLDDIKRIKSYNVIETNIEGAANIPGIIRYQNDTIEIIQGDTTYNFKKNQIVSLAKSGERERNYWSGKITISVDLRNGNKHKFDYTANGTVLRRTALTKLRFDYIGRISKTDGIETANDHRVNEKYDIYITRYFFWTPIFAEYYQNIYQNIAYQYTVGVGLGYTIVHRNDIEWDVSGGPGLLHTNFRTVTVDEEQNPSSFAMDFSTRLEYELTNQTDIIYQYKITLTDKKSGSYKHHMVMVLENEILDWLDFDVTGVWDRTEVPEVEADGSVPLKNDYQLLMGIGIEF